MSSQNEQPAAIIPSPPDPSNTPNDNGNGAAANDSVALFPPQNNADVTPPPKQQALIYSPPPKQATKEERATVIINTKPQYDLEQLTRMYPRDVMGRTIEEIGREGRAASNAMTAYSKAVAVEYKTLIAEKVTAELLAQAPLRYIKELKAKSPCLNLGASYTVCERLKSISGCVWRDELGLITKMLLEAMKSKFGLKTEVVVREIEYGPMQFLYMFPGTTYIEVIIINCAVVYARTAAEIVESQLHPNPAPLTMKTGDEDFVTLQ